MSHRSSWRRGPALHPLPGPPSSLPSAHGGSPTNRRPPDLSPGRQVYHVDLVLHSAIVITPIGKGCLIFSARSSPGVKFSYGSSGFISRKAGLPSGISLCYHRDPIILELRKYFYGKDLRY
jgi:hypothetical protein